MSVDIDKLLQQLKLDEKLLLLAGKNFWETHEIPRLDIPSLKVTDGPSGARGDTFIDGTPAACFPACVSLAATFDCKLARRVGKALAEETQSKGAYVLLGPTVCIHRSPLGGRNFESFSEDPLLAGILATEYVGGLQEERVAPSVKHFFANEQDTRRFVLNEVISERTLREIYLKPFEIVVKNADPWKLMTAYPKVNGDYIDATSEWLTQVLREEWGFKGLTMSDWGAASTSELDLEMPGPARRTTAENIREELSAGRLTEQQIDTRVRTFLELLVKVGKFDDRCLTPPEQSINRPEHRALIREAGAAGMTLLKNERNVLPIEISKTKKIAFLGPLADHASAHGGGSSFLTCSLQGCEIYRSLPDFVQGVKNRKGVQGFDVDYFPTYDATGPIIKTDQVHRSYFTTHDQIDIKAEAMSAKMTGVYKPTETGNHYLSLSGAGVTKLLVDGQLVVSQDSAIVDAMAFIAGCQDEIQGQHFFEVGKEYQIEVVTIMPDVTISDSHILDKQLCAHVGFVAQAAMERDLQTEAVVLAKEADVAVVFVGNTYQWESEGQDMGAMVLPPYNNRAQDALISAVAAVNPNTVVMMNTGVAVELPWLNDVAGLVQGWYAGQEVGNAIVDVLVGAVTPSGKLPISWPKKYEDVVCYGHYGLDSMQSKEVEYVEGVFVGYRHYDRHWGGEKEVAFPFGFGLSYTDFEISVCVITGSISGSKEDKIVVEAMIKNVGQRHGAQTAQVYIEPPQTEGLDRPVKELAGFAKVHLKPGQEERVQIEVSRDALSYWDSELDQWKVIAGEYGVVIATSSHPKEAFHRGSIKVDKFVYAA